MRMIPVETTEIFGDRLDPVGDDPRTNDRGKGREGKRFSGTGRIKGRCEK